MVESGMVLENMIQEAHDLMMQNKHIDSEMKLREIDDAAEGGSLVDKTG